jgi:signal transduction histidine kinase
MTPSRVALRFLVLLCLFAMACAAWPQAPGASAVTEITSVIWMPAKADGTPDDTQAQPVTLPDDLKARNANKAPSWYRAEFTLLSKPSEMQAVFFPGLQAHVNLFINGLRVASTGNMSDAPLWGWRQTRLFTMPDEVLKPGTNEMLMQVGGRTANGRVALMVAPLQIGSENTLSRRYYNKLFANAVGPVIVSSVMSVLAAFSLLLWAKRRADPMYAYFGAGGLLWALHNVWLQSPQNPLPQPHHGVLWTALFPLFVGFLMMFCIRFAGKRLKRFELVVWIVSALAIPLLYLAEHYGHFDQASTALRFYSIVVALVGAAVVARHAWQTRSTDSVLLVATGLVSVAFGVHDFLLFENRIEVYPVWLVPYAGMGFIILVGWMLLNRFIRNYDTVTRMNEILEQRVREKTYELEANYAQLREAERQQTMLQERARIMQDMHDGLGTQMMVSMRSLERGELSQQQAAGVLRECMDELRLTIDALSEAEGDVVALLAHLRYRLADKLRAAGVEIEWKVREVPHMPQLAGTGGRELMRIVQEALNNVLKHSGASRVTFESGYDARAHHAFVSIRDNGCGITPPKPDAPRGGHGLTNMQRRAQKIGATMTVSALPAGGTDVRLELPLAATTA